MVFRKVFVGCKYEVEREALLRLLAVRLSKQHSDPSFIKWKSRIVEHALDRLLVEEDLLTPEEIR